MLIEDNSQESSSVPQSSRTGTHSGRGLGGFFVLTLVLALFMGAVGGAAVTAWGNPILRALGFRFPAAPVDQYQPGQENSTGVPDQPLIPVTDEEAATKGVVKQVSPSVVSIIISKDLSKIYNSTGTFPFDNFFDFGSPFNLLFPQQQQVPQGKQEIGGGTGFVINKEKGLIITNQHVVSDTEADYTVLTNDGKRYDATVVARDTVNDMALVQIKDASLPAVTLGDSDGVQIGQTVIAIGNALGEYRNTVTKGVISGIGRNVVAGNNQGSSEQLEGVFQTDAAINPGNSGGPLLSLQGQVIGINTAVSREGQLIGFAIPINEAKRMVSSFEKYGKLVRPYLGIRYVVITPELASANKLEKDYGALIIRGQQQTDLAVVPGSPADKAGLLENDIILEIAGQKIDQDHSLVKALSSYNPGDKVTFKVYHKGETKDVTVTLGEFKE